MKFKKIMKKLTIVIVKFLKLKKAKRKIPYKDSIRPMKTRTINPPGWIEPMIYTCQDGTEIPYGFRLTTLDKVDRIPCSDAIDNSY